MRKKMEMKKNDGLSFEEGCLMYLEDCRRRNLREGTIRHYKDSFTQFTKFFSPLMQVCEMNEERYYEYLAYLREKMGSDVSVLTYGRDLRTLLHFLMKEGYVKPFKIKGIKTDQHVIETYSDEELELLLKKPNIKKCRYLEYQAWVMTNFLFSTGLRQRSMINILIQDVDLDNRLIHVRATKNRKLLIIPINQTMTEILREFLRYRQNKSDEDIIKAPNRYARGL